MGTISMATRMRVKRTSQGLTPKCIQNQELVTSENRYTKWGHSLMVDTREKLGIVNV